jgi:hypothetical protein
MDRYRSCRVVLLVRLNPCLWTVGLAAKRHDAAGYAEAYHDIIISDRWIAPVNNAATMKGGEVVTRQSNMDIEGVYRQPSRSQLPHT